VGDSEPEDTGRERPAYDPERVRTERSYGNVGESHWSRTRRELHQEELEHLRERSRAPGVAEGGALRNHYCLKCHGVIPLDYAMTESADTIPEEHCPHCGAALEGNVRMMFNWVEIDQVPGSDLRALLPLAVGGLVVLALVALALWWWLSA
jgi:hypothetical protein